ncbi:hypothetical protein KAJ27_25030 [bacterium]|nr:hypothetical protein [bacterium]
MKINANGCVNKTIDLDELKNYKMKFQVKLMDELYPVKHVCLVYNNRKQVTGFKNSIRIMNNPLEITFENRIIILNAIPIYNTILKYDQTNISVIQDYVSGISEKKPVYLIKKYYLSKIRKKLSKLVEEYVKKQTIEHTMYVKSKLIFFECRLYSLLSYFSLENDWLYLFTDLIVNRVYTNLEKKNNLSLSQYSLLLRTENFERFIEIIKFSEQLKKFKEKTFVLNVPIDDIQKIERLIFHIILYSENPAEIIKRFKNSIGKYLDSEMKRDMKANYLNNLRIILKELNCYAPVKFYPDVQKNEEYYEFISPCFNNRKIYVYRNGKLIFIKKGRYKKIILDRDLISDKDVLVFFENNKDIVYIYSPYYFNQNLGKTLSHFFSK